MRKYFLLALCATAGASAAAFGNEDHTECRKQIEGLCPGLRPGDGKWWPCLKEHQGELSQECRQKIESKAGGEACRKETERVCPGMRPGDGKWWPCVMEHQSDLSEECRRKFASKKQSAEENGKGGTAPVCSADAEKLCSGLRPGDGKFGPCMKEHREDLSEPCRSFISQKFGGPGRKNDRNGAEQSSKPASD